MIIKRFVNKLTELKEHFLTSRIKSLINKVNVMLFHRSIVYFSLKAS